MEEEEGVEGAHTPACVTDDALEPALDDDVELDDGSAPTSRRTTTCDTDAADRQITHHHIGYIDR